MKLTKLDQNSEIAIQKEGKALEIEVKSGSLFFNITEPLADDETMNIRASTMLVGILNTLDGEIAVIELSTWDISVFVWDELNRGFLISTAIPSKTARRSTNDDMYPPG